MFAESISLKSFDNAPEWIYFTNIFLVAILATPPRRLRPDVEPLPTRRP
jgi:hypothetical protein